MHPRYSPIDDIRRLQEWKTFQPKTRRLCLTVPELPRLYNLVWLLPSTWLAIKPMGFSIAIFGM